MHWRREIPQDLRHCESRRARAGLIAPDQTTFDYIRGRPKAPTGANWDAAMRYWEKLRSDDGRNTIIRPLASCAEALGRITAFSMLP